MVTGVVVAGYLADIPITIVWPFALTVVVVGLAMHPFVGWLKRRRTAPVRSDG